jgi:hypothetical protein
MEPFHTADRHVDVLSIISSSNLPSDQRCGTIVVLGSQHHSSLIRALHCHGMRSVARPQRDCMHFPRLTLTRLNACLEALRCNAEPWCDKVRAEIGAEYSLPDTFQACLLPGFGSLLTLLAPGILRCLVTDKAASALPELPRVQCSLNCTLTEPITSARTSPVAAFEKETLQQPEVWPILLQADHADSHLTNVVQQHLQVHGFAALPVPDQLGERLEDATAKHLAALLGMGANSTLAEVTTAARSGDRQYRVRGQPKSRHIPAGHGRTGYGCCFQAAADMARAVAPLVHAAVGAQRCWVTSCEIICRC